MPTVTTASSKVHWPGGAQHHFSDITTKTWKLNSISKKQDAMQSEAESSEHQGTRSLKDKETSNKSVRLSRTWKLIRTCAISKTTDRLPTRINKLLFRQL